MRRYAAGSRGPSTTTSFAAFGEEATAGFRLPSAAFAAKTVVTAGPAFSNGRSAGGPIPGREKEKTVF